ncbi:hypothetical protein ACFSC3_06550 [Sphingomonas floccifaciens]|uniref:Uncharacterized protein n=2 Tax=Sphingomonas floccifaciens TaxID=1844115 RepID=A0ABW4ND28_9SPHN
MATALPASAQTAPKKTLGAWSLAVSRDGQGCFVTRRFDGPGETVLMLGLDSDGSNHLTILNGNWSIVPKQALTLEFRLSRGGYGDHAAIGIDVDGTRGFVATFEPRFPDHFAASERLDIYRGKMPVARLDLTGSGAAVAELKRCTAKQAPGAKGSSPSSDVPIDPFAAGSARKSKR